MTSGDYMSNICNELRNKIIEDFDLSTDWVAVTDLIKATPTESNTVYNWQILKFEKTVEFRGYNINVLILSKRVYAKDGSIAYIKDIYAEQWV